MTPVYMPYLATLAVTHRLIPQLKKPFQKREIQSKGWLTLYKNRERAEEGRLCSPAIARPLPFFCTANGSAEILLNLFG